MRVTPESPVQDKESYLYKWDTEARKYFNHFEIHQQGTREGIERLFRNIFTRNKDPIQYRYRYQQLDMLAYRQLLGQITSQECCDACRNTALPTGTFLTRSSSHPAQINGWNLIPMAAWGAFGTFFAVYAPFVKKYNKLWMIGSFMPFAFNLLHNWARQPNQKIENAYKYILAKRAATCELEKNTKKFNALPIAQTKEFHALQSLLRNKDQTLYQLEQDVVERITQGLLR